MSSPSASNAKTTSPFLILFIGILAVSTSSIFIRFAQQEMPSLVIAAWRLTFASLILCPITFFKERSYLTNITRKQVIWMIVSGIFLALHFATWISSLEFTTVASSVVFVSTSPLWVALASFFFLKEKISLWTWIGLFLAIIGSFFVGASSLVTNNGISLPLDGLFLQGRTITGNFLALGGAFAGAGYILIGRKIGAGLPFNIYIAVVYAMAAIFLIFFALAAGNSLWGFPVINYGWCLLLALVPQLIGHSSFNYALRFLPAAYVSIVLLGEPIGTSLLALIILQETPRLFEIMGGLIILSGILLSSKPQK